MDDNDFSKGTKAGVNKLFGIYYRIPCISPEFQARLSNIVTSAIVYSKHKAFVISHVYRKTWEDLKKLPNEGIESAERDKPKMRIYFATILMKIF